MQKNHSHNLKIHINKTNKINRIVLSIKNWNEFDAYYQTLNTYKMYDIQYVDCNKCISFVNENNRYILINIFKDRMKPIEAMLILHKQ